MSKIGYKQSLEHRKKISEATKGRPAVRYWSGKKRSEETKLKISNKKKGRKNPHKGVKHTREAKIKIGLASKGSRNPSWKGGVTPINRSIRTSVEYKLWRKSVFERDGYTCIWCRIRGVEIHADHIKPFALYPELRFAIDNGRTLCKPCHMKTDTWGFKSNKK